MKITSFKRTFRPTTHALVRPLLLSLSLVAALSMVACGSSKQEGAKNGKDGENGEAKKDDPLEGAPVWVTQDCRNHFKDEPVICGVGSVSGVESASLARNTAMARGRTEISRYLSVEVRSIITDYQAQTGGKTEQEIQDQSTQISEMTLSGSRMASYFIGKDGTYYSLMVLELEAFKESVEASSTIEQELKQALLSNANKAFSVRDSEVSRY
jgi:hypothetical protein